jgi:hypothetical protein
MAQSVDVDKELERGDKKRGADIVDRYTMIWQLTFSTKYSEEYLLKLSDEELEKLYRERVLKQNGENAAD